MLPVRKGKGEILYTIYPGKAIFSVFFLFLVGIGKFGDDPAGASPSFFLSLIQPRSLVAWRDHMGSLE